MSRGPLVEDRLSSTRSTPVRSPTPTATASGTSPGSSSTSTTSSGWASTASGSARSPSRPTPTGATTWPTTAPSQPDLGTIDDVRPPRRRGRPAGHPGPARPGAQPHQRPAPLVRRLAARRRRRATATGTCGRTPGPTARPPNNWVSSFGGPAWTLDPVSGQYYLHNHLVEQPDLNWWNEEVRAGLRRDPAASGPTGAWPASGSTSATSSSRTPSSGTTRRPPTRTISRPSSSGSGRSTTPTAPRSTRSCVAGGAWPTRLSRRRS